MEGAGESKEEEREDSIVSQASSVDSWENCSTEGSEDRTVEANIEGKIDLRLWRLVTM